MILVTGATGSIGGEVARILHARGQKTRVLVRDPQRAAGLPTGIERVTGDLSRPETLAPALEGVDRVFLMEASHGSEHTAAMATAATRAGVRHIVDLSSMGVTFQPMPAMGRWHADREDILTASGAEVTFLRPSTLMTNALWWLPSIRARGMVVDPIGPGRLSSVDPADVAEVATVALTGDGHAGQAYVLTGSELLTVKDQVAILSEVLGREIGYTEQTPREAAEARRAQGAPPQLVDASRELNELFRADRIAFLSGEVQRLTGRAPRTFRNWCQRNAALFG
jgi:uncharacterized protein YbjT (DUF2867 family)